MDNSFRLALRHEAQLLADGKPSTLKPELAIAIVCKIVLRSSAHPPDLGADQPWFYSFLHEDGAFKEAKHVKMPKWPRKGQEWAAGVTWKERGERVANPGAL